MIVISCGDMIVIVRNTIFELLGFVVMFLTGNMGLEIGKSELQ